MRSGGTRGCDTVMTMQIYLLYSGVSEHKIKPITARGKHVVSRDNLAGKRYSRTRIDTTVSAEVDESAVEWADEQFGLHEIVPFK